MVVSIICQPLGVFAIRNQHHWGTTVPQSPFSPSFHRSVSAGSCTWRCAAAAATVRRLDVDSGDGEDGGDEACAVRSQGHCSATAVLGRCDGSCHVALGDASSFSKKAWLNHVKSYFCGRKWVTNPCFCPSFVQNHLREELLHQLQGFCGGFAAHALHWATLLDR